MPVAPSPPEPAPQLLAAAELPDFFPTTLFGFQLLVFFLNQSTCVVDVILIPHSFSIRARLVPNN